MRKLKIGIIGCGGIARQKHLPSLKANEEFETVYYCIRAFVPKARIGGGAIFVYDNMEIFEAFVSGWSKRSCCPDFISIWIFAYELLKDGMRKKVFRVLPEAEYVSRKVKKAIQIMKKYDLARIPVYVTQWDLSLSSRNFINESCYRGVYILKSVIDTISETSIMACSGSTDLLCDFYDSIGFIFGGRGLITINKLKKPAYYACEFLQQMEKYLIDRGENYLVTTDAEDKYAIIIFNISRIDMELYKKKGENIAPDDIRELFENDELKVRLQLRNIRNGAYLIRQRSLSCESGDIINGWESLGYKKRFNKEELHYLQAVSTPKMNYRNREVSDNALSLVAALKTNEIQLYQIECTNKENRR